jgi:uncharacterized protein (UPF0297 family)
MEASKTTVVDTKAIIDKNVKEELLSISNDLDERGYEPEKQIVAYLISGDPGYITSYKDARKLMMSIDRSKALEILVKKALQ